MQENENIPLNTQNKKTPPLSKSLIGNLIAFLFGLAILVISLLLIETFFRFKYKDPAPFYYNFNAKLLNHAALFKRSLDPDPSDPYPRVFCLGGSTTNGCNMPIRKSYPNLLDAFFKATNTSGTAYNFGISGVNSVTTNFFIKNILPGYDPSCVVMHDGYNDLPIVIEKIGEDKYTYITPDYTKPYNPYIKNPIIRYLFSFIKFNLRSIRRFVITFVKKGLKKGGDLFLGFDYKQHTLHEGTSKDILAENKKRLPIMLKAEINSIDYCLKHGIKVIIILEPHIKPMHFVPPFGSGFRDKNVGAILSDCHKLQQAVYAKALITRYKNVDNIIILDMRDIFKDRYPELFYDECHLNGKGNGIKAQYVYAVLKKLFNLKPND